MNNVNNSQSPGDPLERVALSLPRSQRIELDTVTAAMGLREPGLDRTEVIRRAIRFFIQNRDDVMAARATITTGVESRLNDKIGRNTLILLAILRVLADHHHLSVDDVNQALAWAEKVGIHAVESILQARREKDKGGS